MTLKRILAGTALTLAATAVLPVASASAAESYEGLAGQIVCFTPDGKTVTTNLSMDNEIWPETSDTDPCVFVAVEGRVGTRTRHWDSTAGAGYVADADFDTTSKVRRVQIDKVVLGTQYGVLTTSGVRNSGTSVPAEAELQGPGHLWGRYCTTNYHVAVYWSARLANGQLKTGKLLGPWYKAPNCR